MDIISRQNDFSSVRGRLGLLFMTAAVSNDEAHFHRILAVLNELPSYSKLMVWCNHQAVRLALEDYLKKQMAADGLLSQVLNEPLPDDFRCLLVSPSASIEYYSKWVRDPFLFRYHKSRNIELIPSRFAKIEDRYWIVNTLKRLVFKEDWLRVEASGHGLPVAGGNLLVDEHIFVGYGQFQQTIGNQDIEAAQQELIEMLGMADNPLPVIMVGTHTGNEPVKLGHIDLFLTLTGTRNPATEAYRVFLAECIPLAATPEPDPRLEQTAENINHFLNHINQELASHGLEVIRMPLPLLEGDSVQRSLLCYFNNCLVECTADLKNVWIPRFSYMQQDKAWYNRLLACEARVTELWEGIGYSVRFIEADFLTAVDELGALHCMTQEMFRIS